ncbi:MAG TPA: DUF1810 domain-containing protein [Candidatus Lachnoclostridium stercorigallinarum]|uniref:DUF1810 domain-containing protein n=1 Tax=Candidatus Lachnoclostridium stercorigallinarum TaxID=2838634 RepID=A0A9D2K641_9FIRM|nr:DUF1810 domain-containing protein [Candidatus Lachnoclostridium stercorigallinarum]
MEYDLSRFLKAQEESYGRALREIRRGRKTGHWMWYIFPQLRGLGMSRTSWYYGISGLEEAKAFLSHPVLGNHLLEISGVLLELPSDDAGEVFGFPDDRKLRSSMTLFACADPDQPMFPAVLGKFFGGSPDERTLELLKDG